jgi:multiple sugar transport system ATP-binding protein
VTGIVLESVRKEFAGGVVAVRDISLEVAPGEFVALVGPSGCGKTTTLRMVAGLEEISAGNVRINGRDVTQMPPRHRDIAMVFQNYALYAHMSIRRNMGFGLKMSKLPKEEIARRVDAAAEVLGIVPLLDRKPKQLSGGERQRVAMGRAMVREPAAFLMDEPLSNLDAKLRVEMRGEIVNLQRRLGTPTLYVTHDQIEAMTMGDRVAILRDGDLQQIGSPEELYERPVNAFVATFIGSPAMNLVRGRLHSAHGEPRVRVGGCDLPIVPQLLRRSPRLSDHPPGEVIVGIRPEDFCGPEQAAPGVHGVIDATVVRAESLGSELIVYFELADEQLTVAPVDGGEPAESARDEAEAVIDEAEPVSGTVVPDVIPRLLTARLGRSVPLREPGPERLGFELERLYFFNPQTGQAIGH